MADNEQSSSPNAVHTVALLLIVGTVLTAPWMRPSAITEEEAAEDEEESMGLFSILRPLLVMLLPVILLVVVRWSSSQQAASTSLALRNADASTIHRITGSSPGLVLVLLVILGMITFQSFLQESLGVAS